MVMVVAPRIPQHEPALTQAEEWAEKLYRLHLDDEAEASNSSADRNCNRSFHQPELTEGDFSGTESSDSISPPPRPPAPVDQELSFHTGEQNQHGSSSSSNPSGRDNSQGGEYRFHFGPKFRRQSPPPPYKEFHGPPHQWELPPLWAHRGPPHHLEPPHHHGKYGPPHHWKPPHHGGHHRPPHHYNHHGPPPHHYGHYGPPPPPPHHFGHHGPPPPPPPPPPPYYFGHYGPPPPHHLRHHGPPPPHHYRHHGPPGSEVWDGSRRRGHDDSGPPCDVGEKKDSRGHNGHWSCRCNEKTNE